MKTGRDRHGRRNAQRAILTIPKDRGRSTRSEPASPPPTSQPPAEASGAAGVSSPPSGVARLGLESSYGAAEARGAEPIASSLPELPPELHPVLPDPTAAADAFVARVVMSREVELEQLEEARWLEEPGVGPDAWRVLVPPVEEANAPLELPPALELTPFPLHPLALDSQDFFTSDASFLPTRAVEDEPFSESPPPVRDPVHEEELLLAAELSTGELEEPELLILYEEEDEGGATVETLDASEDDVAEEQRLRLERGPQAFSTPMPEAIGEERCDPDAFDEDATDPRVPALLFAALEDALEDALEAVPEEAPEAASAPEAAPPAAEVSALPDGIDLPGVGSAPAPRAELECPEVPDLPLSEAPLQATPLPVWTNPADARAPVGLSIAPEALHSAPVLPEVLEDARTTHDPVPSAARAPLSMRACLRELVDASTRHDWEAITRLFQQARGLDPDDGRPYALLGASLIRAGALLEARGLLATGLMRTRPCRALYETLLEVELRLERTESARRLLKLLLARFPHHGPSVARWMPRALELGEVSLAEQLLEEASTQTAVLTRTLSTYEALLRQRVRPGGEGPATPRVQPKRGAEQSSPSGPAGEVGAYQQLLEGLVLESDRLGRRRRLEALHTQMQALKDELRAVS